MKTEEKLQLLNAPESLRTWAIGKDWPEIIDTCERGDWLLWLAPRVGVRHKLVVLAAVRSARLAQQWMPGASIEALDVVEKWCRGEATDDQMRDAASAAAYAAARVAYVAYVAYAETLKKSADICRKAFGKELLEAVRR